MKDLDLLRQWVQESNRMVFFGGASEYGVGDPGFPQRGRPVQPKFDYPPETIISHRFYRENRNIFSGFTGKKMLPLDLFQHHPQRNWPSGSRGQASGGHYAEYTACTKRRAVGGFWRGSCTVADCAIIAKSAEVSGGICQAMRRACCCAGAAGIVKPMWFYMRRA